MENGTTISRIVPSAATCSADPTVAGSGETSQGRTRLRALPLPIRLCRPSASWPVDFNHLTRMMTLPKRKKGQSLVEAARAAVTNGYRLGPLTDDELELVIGFLSGDFSHRQVQMKKL